MEAQKQEQKRNIILTAVILAVIAIVSSVIVVILLYIQNSDKNNKSYYTADYIASGVISKMNYQNLTEISVENIPKYYDIPQNMLTDSAMYISNQSDMGTEIACFKFKYEEDEEEIYKTISQYTGSKVSTYKSVNGEKINAKTDISYPYVFVVISSDSDNAVNAFEDIINKKE